MIGAQRRAGLVPLSRYPATLSQDLPVKTCRYGDFSRRTVRTKAGQLHAETVLQLQETIEPVGAVLIVGSTGGRECNDSMRLCRERAPLDNDRGSKMCAGRAATGPVRS